MVSAEVIEKGHLVLVGVGTGEMLGKKERAFAALGTSASPHPEFYLWTNPWPIGSVRPKPLSPGLEHMTQAKGNSIFSPPAT